MTTMTTMTTTTMTTTKMISCRADNHAEPTGEMFKALGNEYRLKILHYLRGGPLSAAQLVVRVGTPKHLLTDHLMRLERDNLITRESEEGRHIYTFSNDHAVAIMDRLQELFR